MATELDSDLLRTFVTIADAGGFTRAAQLVHRTQSAVSMQMKRLEENVGKPLFERDGRSVVLTLEGETLLGYARRILKLQDEVIASLNRPDMVGLVRIGTPDDYVARFLPPVLARFAQAYPHIQVEVRCEPSALLTEALDNGELDLTLITCDSDAVGDQILRREPTVWACSERHFAQERNPLPLALFQKGCFLRNWAIRALDDMERSYRVAYTSPSLTGVLAAVSAGLAVTVLGESILPPGIRVLTAEEGFPPFPPANIVLRRAPRQKSKVIDCLAQHLAEGFATPQEQAA